MYAVTVLYGVPALYTGSDSSCCHNAGTLCILEVQNVTRYQTATHRMRFSSLICTKSRFRLGFALDAPYSIRELTTHLRPPTVRLEGDYPVLNFISDFCPNRWRIRHLASWWRQCNKFLTHEAVTVGLIIHSEVHEDELVVQLRALHNCMTVIDGVFCLERRCDEQTRDAFQPSPLTSVVRLRVRVIAP